MRDNLIVPDPMQGATDSNGHPDFNVFTNVTKLWRSVMMVYKKSVQQSQKMLQKLLL